MSAILVNAVLGLLEELLPLLGQASVVGKVIAALEAIVPLVVKEVQDVAPQVQAIIAAVKNSSALTQADVVKLQPIDAQIDAAFDAAAAKAEAEDAAAAGQA